MKRILNSFLFVVATLQVINCFAQTKTEPAQPVKNIFNLYNQARGSSRIN